MWGLLHPVPAAPQQAAVLGSISRPGLLWVRMQNGSHPWRHKPSLSLTSPCRKHGLVSSLPCSLLHVLCCPCLSSFPGLCQAFRDVSAWVCTSKLALGLDLGWMDGLGGCGASCESCLGKSRLVKPLQLSGQVTWGWGLTLVLVQE